MKLPTRVKIILLLVRCIIKSIYLGAANHVPSSPSRILVVPTGKLGDIVCTTPVLVALRSHFPKARIIIVGNSSLNRPLLNDSGLVDEYINFKEMDEPRHIKECHADVALVTGPTFELTAAMYLAGVPLIVAPKVVGGFSPHETRSYKLLQHFVRVFPYKIGQYAPRERLGVLGPLGINYRDTSKHLGFSVEADTRVSEFFIHNDIDVESDFVAGITPSAGHKIKEWPEERFAEVADHLSAAHKARVILIGGPNDKEKIDKTKSYLKSNTKIIEATDFNIDELKALVSKLNLFVSVDTGPIYIAEAFNIPTIDITGPIDEKEQPPQGPMHRNVVPLKRSKPELFVLNARSYDRVEALRQVNSITTSQVNKEIDQLVNTIILSSHRKSE